jgi:hypothetical protein
MTHQVTNQINTGFDRHHQEMKDLHRKFDFMFEQFTKNNTLNETPTIDGTTFPPEHPVTTPTFLPHEIETVAKGVIMDTPTPNSVGKPTYTTPINKWQYPKRAAKARPTVTKKIVDKIDSPKN